MSKSYSRKQFLSLIAVPFVASAAASIMITVPTSAHAAATTVSSSTATTFDLTGGDMLTVTNSGTINASAQSDHAVAISNSTNTVYNAGNIIGPGSTSYYAIFANSGATDTTIVNQQTNTTATNTPMIYVPAGRAIRFDGDLDSGSSLTNAGIIGAGSSDPAYGTVYAVGVSVNGDIDGTITNMNNGTIYASAITSAPFDIPVGVYAYGDLGGSLDNSGAITAHGSNAASGSAMNVWANGVWLDEGYGGSSGDLAGTMTNSGTISATNNVTAAYGGGSGNFAIGTAFGVNVDNLSGELTNEYGGMISGDVAAVAHDGSTNFAFAGAAGIYVDDELSGDLSNSGTISGDAEAEAAYGSWNGAYAQASGVRDALNGTVINNGDITGSATAIAHSAFTNNATAVAYGYHVAGDINGLLDNNGNIAANAAAQATSGFSNQAMAYGAGVYVSGDINVTGWLDNSGTISADVSANAHYGSSNMAAAYGAGVFVTGQLDGEIDNSGTIEAEAFADAYSDDGPYNVGVAGINILGHVDPTGVIDNSGTVSALYEVNESTAYGTIAAIPVGNAAGIHLGSDGYGFSIAAGGELGNSGTVSATVNAVATAGTSEAYGSAAAAHAYGDNVHAVGVELEGGIGAGEASLNNSGTMSVSGTINATANAYASDTAQAIAYGGQAAGIYSGYGGMASGADLVNSGKISGTVKAMAHAVATATEAEAAAYAGGFSAAGIYLEDGGIDAGFSTLLDNSGTISGFIDVDATATADNAFASGYGASGAFGILMDGEGVIGASATLLNSGTMSISGAIEVDVIANGENEAYGYIGEVQEAFGINMGDLNGTLDNDGGAITASISANATASGSDFASAWIDEVQKAFGINMGDLNGTLDNDGSISASLDANAKATASAYGGAAEAWITEVEDATAVKLDNIFSDAELINTGTIRASINATATASANAYASAGLWDEFSDAKAIAIGNPWSGGGNFLGTLDNQGTIEASITAKAKATQMDGEGYMNGWAWAQINQVERATGIGMGYFGTDAEFYNSGTISASIAANAAANGNTYASALVGGTSSYWIGTAIREVYGLNIDSNLNGLLDNSGQISAGMHVTGAASAYGAWVWIPAAYDVYGIDVGNLVPGASLTNSGTLSAISASLTVKATVTAIEGDASNSIGSAHDVYGINIGNIRGDLTNNGTIEASLTAMVTADADDWAWGSVNSVYNVYGIDMNNFGVDATLTNTGQISAMIDIDINAIGGASATASQDAAYGVYGLKMGDSYFRGDLVNHGTISAGIDVDAAATGDEAFAYGSAHHVYGLDTGTGLNINSSLTNYGDISATIDAGVSASADDDEGFAQAWLSNADWVYGIDTWNVQNVLTNEGTIGAEVTAMATATATSGAAHGMIDNAGQVFGINMNNLASGASLTNAGEISAGIHADVIASGTSAATASISAAYNAYGLEMNNLLGDLTNSGTISGSIEASATATATNGLANAYVDVHDVYGIKMSEFDAGATLDNYGGTISGSAMATASASGTAPMLSNQASASAVDIYGVSVMGNLDGMMTNSGTISASGSASATASSSGGRAVAGSFDPFTSPITAAPIAGLWIGNNLDGELDNSGTISGTAMAEGSGVTNATAVGGGIVIADDLEGTLTNTSYGSISAMATASNLGTSANALAAGILTAGSIDGTTLDNDGTISAEANASAASNAIAVAGGIFSMNLENGATVDNGAYGSISAQASAGATATTLKMGSTPTYQAAIAGGVLVLDATDSALTNAGTISATATAGANAATTPHIQAALAAGVLAGNANGFTITNNGMIEAQANADTFTFTGSGLSTLDIHFAGAAGVFAGSFNGGTLTNSGTIRGMANDLGEDGAYGYSIVLDPFNSDTVAGSVSNMSGGLLYGNLYTGGDITVNNSGTIHLPAGANAVVEGDYNQTSASYGGELSIGVLNKDTFGNLTVNGNAAFFDDATGLHVELEPGLVLADGDPLYDVVNAYGAAGGLDFNDSFAVSFANDGVTSVTDDSFLFDFTAIENGLEGDEGYGTIDLITSRRSIEEIVVGEGIDSGAGAGGLFDDWFDDGYPEEMQDLMDALAQADSEEEIAQIVAELLPVFQGDLPRAVLDALADARRVVRIRQDGEQGANSGDDSPNSNVWAKAFGSRANQDNNSGAFGYDADIYGALIGVDTGVGTAGRIGAAFAYSRADVDNNTPVNHDADVDTFQGILYGTFILSPVSDIDWQINYAVHNYETRRSMPSWGGLVARADYDGWSGHVGAHYDHRIALSENASFTPSVRAEYTKVEDDDYSETGAGIYNLDVDSNDIDELILGIDGTLAVGLGSNALFSVNAGVGFDALDEDGTITASFAGDPGSATFKTTGVDPSPWLARAGANLTIGADDSVQFSAEYDIEVRDDFTNQSAALKLKIPF